jgi:hypothetical protein
MFGRTSTISGVVVHFDCDGGNEFELGSASEG